MFATKGMYCVECKKKVQIDTSKRSQCPDCHSYRVTECVSQSRSKSQAPTNGQSRLRKQGQPIVRPGHGREEPNQLNHQVTRQPEAPIRTQVPRQPPAQRQPENKRQQVQVTRTFQPLRRGQPAPREEIKQRPSNPRIHLPMRQRVAPPVLVRGGPQSYGQSHQSELHRPSLEDYEASPVPRPLIQDSDEELEEDRERKNESPVAMAAIHPQRHMRLIRIRGPLEALELLNILPQRQAAVLYFIMHGLGLFGGDERFGEDPTSFFSFEDMLSHLVSMRPDNVHPASQDYMAHMETARVTRDTERRQEMCAICQDTFKIGDCANRLPCQHMFHGECVVPWLRTNSTCPVCRQSVDS